MKLIAAFLISALFSLGQAVSPIQSRGFSIQVTNDTSTGTALNLLAKIVAGHAIRSFATDTNVPVFIVIYGAGITGSATLAMGGAFSCTMDAGGATADHFIVNSTASNGRCMDAGSTPPLGGWVIGQAQATVGSNANAQIRLVQGYNGGGSALPYTICAAGCTTSTFPTSGTVIAVNTHGQGINATGYAISASTGDEMSPPNFEIKNDGSGNLTIIYVTQPSKIVIFTPGAAGSGGASLPGGASQTQYLQAAPNSGNVSTYQWNNLPTFSSADYNYSITPSSPSTLTSGSNTITLAICPLGIIFSGTWAPMYFTAGSGGTAEVATPTGGTCSSATLGSTGGTVVVTLSNSHGAGYMVNSATAGMQEAVFAMGTVGGNLSIPIGTSQVYARTSIVQQHICIQGTGPDSTFINNNSTSTGVFIFQLVSPPTVTGGGCLANLTISAGGTTSTSITGSNSTAVLVNGIGNSETGMSIHDVIVKNHNINVDLEGVLYVYLTNFTLLYQNSYGVKVNGSAFINNGVISNAGASGLPAGSSGAGLFWVDGAGLYAHNVDITAMPNGVEIQPISAGSISAGFFTDILADTSNSHGWLLDSTNGPILQIELTGCWGGFNGCYSPATLPSGITNSQTSITVTPSTSAPYPTGVNHLTIDSEQISCTSYSSPTFSGCSRAQFGTSAASHATNANVFVCNFAGDGIHVQGSNTIDGITVNGGMFSGNAANGMNFTAGKNIQVVGSLISQNSSYQNQLYNQISFAAGVSNWAIRSSTLGNYATILPVMTGYGVSIGSGSSDSYVISGNQFVNLALGTISDGGSGVHKVIEDNLGIDEQVPSVASATALAFPFNPTFSLTGTTTVTSVLGLWSGRRGTFVTPSAVPFSAGATIGNSCTTTPSKPYSYYFDGTKIWIGGNGC